MHVGGAAVGGEQAGGHGERRRLARTVRPDDPVEGSGGDVEGQVRDGDEVAINFDEASDGQCDIIPDGGGGYRRCGGLRIGHEILLQALKYLPILREIQANAQEHISRSRRHNRQEKSAGANDDGQPLVRFVRPRGLVGPPLLRLGAINGAGRIHAFAHRRRDVKLAQNALENRRRQTIATVIEPFKGERGLIVGKPSIDASPAWQESTASERLLETVERDR